VYPHACVNENAWFDALPATSLDPTTWPLALIASAVLALPPRVPRSTIPPAGVHENAWVSTPDEVVRLYPTTWPLAFTARAALLGPPRGPGSMAMNGVLAPPPLPASSAKGTRARTNTR